MSLMIATIIIACFLGLLAFSITAALVCMAVQDFLRNPLVIEWRESRKRSAYDAYIDSEEKRRTEFQEEMSRLGFNSLNASASELNRMYNLYRKEFPDLYKNKRIEE